MTPEQKELLREATLEALVACHPVPRPTHAIRRILLRQVTFAFAEDDLRSVLEFLVGLGFVSVQNDPLGSTRWWTATPDGILTLERKQ